ncbi:MAG: ATP-binding protein [Holosporaceae bacterium]|jgi:AAA15 family ATPase/GTPase|nr:ATP-binding protein [Holosporaceae bacterium]
MNVKIEKLKINKFRIFNEKEIRIGKWVTVIAGGNGTGKSNILGMLANSVEYKVSRKRKSTVWDRHLFRADFGELFKGYREFAQSGSNLFEVFFSDNETRLGRITWQNTNKGIRFRVIPYVKGNTSSKKKELAVIHLGLSRLFPLGEADKCDVGNIRVSSDNEEDYKWFVEKAQRILQMRKTPIKRVDTLYLHGNSPDKKTVGLNTDYYNALANSSGQDNVGQILSALICFRNLKKQLGDDYPGGLLLIDEFEATLHPIAQIRLLETIIEECRKEYVQVCFTTHSLFLLEELCIKTQHNQQNIVNSIEMSYLSNAGERFEIFPNPEFDFIKNDLKQEMAPFADTRKVTVYTEDNEARWLLRNLLLRFGFLDKVNILDPLAIGCEAMRSLYKADPLYFKDTLGVLDGDAYKGDVNDPTNIIFLPQKGKSPESTFLDYLCDDQQNVSDFYDHEGIRKNLLTREVCIEKRENMTKQNGELDRVEAKNWFNEVFPYFDRYGLFDYWYYANAEIIDQFKADFTTAFNIIAKRLRIAQIV